MRSLRFLSALLLALGLGVGASGAQTSNTRIPTGEEPAAWKAVPAEGVDLKLASDTGVRGRALRLDFDFRGGGGYAVAHRAVSLEMPANYRFTFRVRGNCRPNNLEFKLIDASGENVWWCNQRDFVFPPEGREVTIRQRHVSFAWGPLGGGVPHHIAALEFAVTAGKGGKGSVWIEDLRMQPLPPPDTTSRPIVASAASGRATARNAVDGDPASCWTSDAADERPALSLDLGAVREFGGLVLDWAPGRQARNYDVDVSSDGKAWTLAHAVRGSNGGRDYVYLPESEARWLRITSTRAADRTGVVALANVTVKPLAWSASMDAFLGAIAHEAPRGDYPRATLGENVFWTVVGADKDPADGLFDEVGRLEPVRGGYSIEPFVRDGGRLVTWNDVTATSSLAAGHLPIPGVEWAWNERRLAITAIGVGTPGRSAIVARYRLSNLSSAARTDTLYLAVRPCQVNPPTQFLNTPGGAATIHELGLQSRVLHVDGGGIVCLSPPADFGAAAFDQGDVVEYLREGRLPPSARMPDDFGRVSGALAYVLDVPAGGTREIAILIPLHGALSEPGIAGTEERVKGFVSGLEELTAARWRARLDSVTIVLPDTDIANALKAQLAYVLVNRDSVAIQPGTRAYARSWIRDGCLTSSALLRLGETAAVREFIEWFAPHQYGNGKAPCCVDARGSDPTPEHDSSGELVFLVAEYVRATGDRAFAAEMWPHVASAVAYLDSLRAQRRTAEWRTPENAPFFGILPPSISHEGYSAKPMHSYWDDFFALRGYKDAAWLAALLGRPERAAIERDRDEFAHDLGASIRAAMAAKHIDWVPGCADLGDFDATSTSIAFDPVQVDTSVVPRALLERTFEKYWEFFRRRESGAEPWEAFTPYEWRNVGAMVHLGWRDRADSASTWLMGFRRPPGFQHWAEVVWHDERAPHFIGDMPHTWVGTDFVRSQLDRLAYEDESDSSLVIGAGVPERWLAGDGVVVKGLHTRWGPISFTMHKVGARSTAAISSADFRVPPGGIRVRLPGDRRKTVLVRVLPATLQF